MVDFSKLNPDRAKEIINALKDGKINANEAKQLGLTAQEAEALNKASKGMQRLFCFCGGKADGAAGTWSFSRPCGLYKSGELSEQSQTFCGEERL